MMTQPLPETVITGMVEKCGRPLLNGGCPMHPGAIRYFKEVKMVK
jgi:TRAP-type uncharacterized transport system substrate-binding protein